MPIRTHVSQRLTRTDKHYKYSISTELKKDEVKTVSHTRSAAHFTKPHLRQYIFQVVLVHLQKKTLFPVLIHWHKLLAHISVHTEITHSMYACDLGCSKIECHKGKSCK